MTVIYDVTLSTLISKYYSTRKSSSTERWEPLSASLRIPETSVDLSPGIVTVRTSLVAQTVKRLPTMWETGVGSLGREDPLEKEMAGHSSTHLENPMDRGAW